jgi:putative flippase GtrA
MTTPLRWLRFNAIGIVGAGLQLWVLHTFTGAGIGYLAATALAVEAALLHNFIWHQRFTWADRPVGRLTAIMGRLTRFHFSNGAVSIVGNLLLMRWLVGGLRASVVVANIIAILVCSIVNFLLGDRFVFSQGGCHA